MISKRAKRQREAFRLEIARDLRLLQRAIAARTEATITNPGLIADAADRLQDDKRVDYWRQDFGGSLVIIPEQRADVFPPGAQLDTVTLSANIRGFYPDDGPVHDRLSVMEIGLELQGRSDVNEALYFAWHFDRHVDGADPSVLMHPRYHVQHAGRALEDMDLSWGQAIFHDAPRLLHPPLDGTLALDLVLANFAPTAWAALRGDPNYLVPVARSITRLWEPYIAALTSGIASRSGAALDLWPCLC
jgi:hypothetical protein